MISLFPRAPFASKISRPAIALLTQTLTGMAALVSLSLATSVAYAQEAADPFAGIEEMIVVGTSASGLLQSEEVSVVGFDSDYLDALGASDLSDIAQFTPNLEIRTPFAASNPTLFIRGVGLRDINANSSSSVAVYNDDIYMNSPAGQLAQLFDVANVDVLRGPQGGIYGRNASAGAIRVISRKPTGNTTDGSLSLTYGRFGQLEIEAAAEAALIPDMVSMRIAGKMSQRGGTTKNRCGDPNFANPGPGPGSTDFQTRVHEFCFNVQTTGDPTFGGLSWVVGQRGGVKERVNDTNNWALRSLIRFQLDVLDGLDILVNFHGGQNLGDARSFQLIGASQNEIDTQPTINNPIDERDSSGYQDPDNQFMTPGAALILDPFIGRSLEGDYSTVEKELLDLFGTSISADLSNGDWNYKLILGYEWNERDTIIDLDGGPRRRLEPDLGNTSWQITGESRIGWDGGDGLSFQIAGMFLYESLEVDNEFELSSFDLRRQDYTMRTRYAAAYGQLEWEPSETLAVSAGARINWEEKELKLSGEALNAFFLRTGFADPLLFSVDDRSEGNEIGWAGDVRVSYLPTDDITFYIKYAHGWKGPHINGLVLSAATTESGESQTTPVDPEEVDSVEFGVKSVFWDSRVKLNGALFLYDYQDLQVFRLRNVSGSLPTNELINAKDADIKGIELDIDIRPFEGIGPPILEGFNLFASFAWLDSSYTEFSVTNRASLGSDQNGNAITTITTIDFSGAQLVNAPKYSFVGFAQWILPTPAGILVPRFDWSFKDRVYFSPENSELVSQAALWLMNFRLTYKAPSENFEISGWVENLTDQRYTVDTFNLARFRRSILYAIGDPRTYGVTMKVTF